MTQLPPTPRNVRTAEEYVGQARRLKAWSGYSYRELSRRAAANGDHLPPSTLATALRRTSLPGEHLVAAFVRACGCDPATVEEWTAVRRRIAMAAESDVRRPRPEMRPGAAAPGDLAAFALDPVDAGPPTASPAASPRWETSLSGPGGEREAAERPAPARISEPVRRPGLVGLLAVSAVTMICAVGGAPQPGRPPVARHTPEAAPDSGRPPAPLADGWYRIHTILDGGCLGVGGPAGDPSVRRQRCGRGAGQRFYFEYAGGRVYRIKAGRPGGGSGCLTVDTVAEGGNLRLHECAPADPSQLLRIEVVPEEKRHRWLPSTLRLRAMADRAGQVLVRATGPDGDDLGFYLTDLERVSGPTERPAPEDP